jgi:hypothetical protein
MTLALGILYVKNEEEDESTGIPDESVASGILFA